MGMATKTITPELPVITMTSEQLRDFAKRCATLGRDAAICVMEDLKKPHGQRIFSDDLQSHLVSPEQMAGVVKVTQCEFVQRFDAVIEKPIQALWQRDLAVMMGEIIADSKIHNADRWLKDNDHV